MPRHQLQVERCGDQLIIVDRHIVRARQPIARAADTKTNDAKATEADKNLSAGERHRNSRGPDATREDIRLKLTRLPIALSSHLSAETDDPGKRTRCRSRNDEGSLRCPCRDSTL